MQGLNAWRIAASHMGEPENLADVLSAVADIALVVSHDGNIIAALANSLSAPIGVIDKWVGKSMPDILTDESIMKFSRVVLTAQSSAEMPRSLELNHTDPAALDYPVQYSTHRVVGEDAILMLGRDLRHVAKAQQQLMQAQIALERGHAERREFDARYRMLLATTRDAIVVIGMSDGRILDLNARAATLLGAPRDELQGAVLAREFGALRHEHFGPNLVSLSQSENDNAITLQARRTGNNIAITPSAFRVGGEQMIICRLDFEAADNPQTDRLNTLLTALFRFGSDGVVITDTKGVIETANEAFVEMVDYDHHADVKGKSLADYLGRGQIDLNTMLDAALESGSVPFHSTRIKNTLGGATSVEVAATILRQGAQPVVAFTLRDVTRAEVFRTPNAGGAVDGSHDNAVKLVGQASLKEIVAAASGVVEKMCIEAAIDMTKNNRAAAAEILGLSRQSLYVKLHKFGIIEDTTEN